jgi:hypothetical protein
MGINDASSERAIHSRASDVGGSGGAPVCSLPTLRLKAGKAGATGAGAK